MSRALPAEWGRYRKLLLVRTRLVRFTSLDWVLADGSACTDCHAPHDAHGHPLPGMNFGEHSSFGAGQIAQRSLCKDPAVSFSQF